MDQLKPILTVLKKHHFWALTAVVLFVAVATWGTATADLYQRYKKRTGELEGKFSNVRQVVGDHNPPNDDVNDYVEKENTILKDDVYEAWKQLYDAQDKKNPLPSVLSDAFKAEWKRWVDRGAKDDDEIDISYREQYNNFIGEYFPVLEEEVDAIRPKPGQAVAPATPAAPLRRPGAGGGVDFDAFGGGAVRPGRDADAAPQVETIGVVRWDNKEIYKIKENWGGRAPSTKQIKLAQEDLWVYLVLLRTIRATNQDEEGEDPSKPYYAAIKEIRALQIGQDALDAWAKAVGDDSRRPSRPSAAPASDDDSEAAAAAAYRRNRRSGTAAASPQATGDPLLAGRYVGLNGEPLSTNDEGEVEHPFAEFKMMPIRMQLLMDQRKIPELLVHCANSTMPVEVLRVRVTPASGDGGRRSPLGGGMGGFGPAMGGGFNTPAPAPGAGSEEGPGPYDVSVEIEGIISIYNPPDVEKLGTGTASEETTEPAEPETPAETPAETTPEETPAAEPAEPTEPAGGGPVTAPSGTPAPPTGTPAGG